MKNTTITEMLIAFALAVVSPAIANAGVWDDCLLWYNGGAVDKNGDGKFTNGEMLDVRHAGIANSPTHGGVLLNASSPYVDSVLIETNDVTFPLQNNRVLKCPVLNFTAPSVTNDNVRSVYGNVVKIQNVLSTDDDTYSALIRFRREEHHGWAEAYQIVMTLGRDYNQKRGLGVVLSNVPSDNNLRIGIAKEAQHDTGLSLGSAKDAWHEVAVIVDGKTVNVGVVDTSAKTAMTWKTYTTADQEASLKPYNTSLTLGGETVSTTAGSVGKTLFRGQIHMVSVWNRVLTTNEVLEAFSSAPSLFQVGLPKVDGTDVFAGASGSASISAQPEDWQKFPASFSAGGSVDITFPLDSTQTDLPQIVRLVPRTGTSGGVSVAVNGTLCGTENIRGGVESYVYVPAGLLRTGENICTITRTDVGSGTVGFNSVQMAGSWRIGYIDNSWNEMQNGGNTSEDFYIETSRRWYWFRRAISKTTPLNVHLGDVLVRWGNNRYIYTWKCRKNDAKTSTMVVKLNGSTIVGPMTFENTDWRTYSVELCETNLVRGADNVLRWESDQSDETWYAFDYHELAVRKPRKGFVITFR